MKLMLKMVPWRNRPTGAWSPVISQEQDYLNYNCRSGRRKILKCSNPRNLCIWFVTATEAPGSLCFLWKPQPTSVCTKYFLFADMSALFEDWFFCLFPYFTSFQVICLKSHLPYCGLPALVQNSPMKAVLNLWKRRDQCADKPGIHAGRLGKVICSQVLETQKMQNSQRDAAACFRRTRVSRWQKRSFSCCSYPWWCGL